jgi:uncharacterized damage-inducible protein DinB
LHVQEIQEAAMANRIERPQTSEYNPRFHDEISMVPDSPDFPGMIRQSAQETARFVLEEFGEADAATRYAPEKWTVREVIGHLSDVERVLSYRALRIARGDVTTLPGFDENAYVPAAQFERRTMQSVVDEFMSVRGSTASLVDGLTDEMAARVGNLAAGTMTVRALLYLIAGHELHHRVLLRERYLPCVSTAATR